MVPFSFSLDDGKRLIPFTANSAICPEFIFFTASVKKNRNIIHLLPRFDQNIYTTLSIMTTAKNENERD